MNFDFIIEEDHFKYLSVQKGDISDFLYDRKVWEQAYKDNLKETYNNIKDALPDREDVRAILDIGSGLGGIDVLLNRHYGNDIEVCLLDGLDDDPIMIKQDKTFNNMKVARDFHMKNGVEQFSYFTPETVNDQTDFKADLIVSFASFAFHFSPEVYMDFIMKVSHPKTVMIVDVRRNKPQWISTLEDHFILVKELVSAPKWQRLKFIRK